MSQEAIPELVSEIWVSAVIPRSETRELLQYFGMGGVNGAFSWSPLAGQLKALELYAFHARPCKRCGGDRKKHIGGTGFVCSSRKARAASDDQRARLALLGIHVDAELPPMADRVCKKCGGRGWVSPKRMTRSNGKTEVTARPTGSSKHGLAPSVTVDASDLATLGSIGKRLEEVRSTHLPSAQALESWFGQPRDDGGQSIRALWHLTDAGKALLKRNTFDLAPAEFFENERTDQAAHPDVNRKITFQAADKQAQQLWERTCRLWNSTAPVVRIAPLARAGVRPAAAPAPSDTAAEPPPESDPVAAE